MLRLSREVAMFLLPLLFACDPGAIKLDDTAARASACACSEATTLAFDPTVVGGFDDWSGEAVVWAIDPAAGRILVVAMAYDLGVATIDRAPACEAPDALVDAWVADTPRSAESDVARYPLLGLAVTTAGGVRSLPHDLGAILLEGDVTGTTADHIRVGTTGGVTLQRNEGGTDQLLGALTFSATADTMGGDTSVDCAESVRIAGLDLAFPAIGSE